MICPNDDVEMRPVKVLSHYGQPIILDQCGGCGGIWFDESELFRARQGEAEQIEPLDSGILRAPSKIEKAVLVCPKDKTELFRFADAYFPKGIILERCPSCNGIWLNRGEFTRFQKAREDLQRPKERSPQDREFEEDIKRLLSASHQPGRADDVLGRLGKFLSTPIDGQASSPQETAQRHPSAEGTISVALNILLTILRIFVLK